MSAERLEILNIGRHCVDPFKHHKKRIVKSLHSIPSKILTKWKIDVRKEK